MKNLNFKRVLSILLTLVLMLSLLPVSGCVADGDMTLTIIHVNDRHGRMGADAYISQLAKNTNGNVLILDAGDALHGQITTNLSEGAAMVELMNAVGYGAMVTGNHEYNYGIDRLLELSKMMDFPLLAANVMDADGKNLFESCVVFEMDGITVGVFGLATPETIASSDPRKMTGLTFADPVETAKAEVAELKAKGCDIIIALTHLGLDDLSDPKDRSDTLATTVPGIDVIIDGHSHTKLDNGLFVGDTLIAQTGEYGENIGVVEITITGNTVSKTAKLIPVPAEDEESDDETPELPADETILAKIAELDAVNEELTSVVVGNTTVFLQGEKTEIRTGQSNLADLITDSMRFATGADIAFMTGGNIRASIDAGDITMGEVLTTLPYSNLLTTVELAGADVLKILEHGVDMYPEAVGHYVHVSGLRFTFDPDAEAGSRVKTATMPDGSALLPDKTYTVATIDFIAAGGDGYDVMENGKDLKYYGGDAEAFIGYLATNPAISAKAEGRVMAAGGETGTFRSDITIAIVPKALDNPYFEDVRIGGEAAAGELGVTLEWVGSGTTDTAGQIAIMEGLIERGVDGILVSCNDADALKEVINRAVDSGISVATFDSDSPDSKRAFYIASDNYAIGKKCAEVLGGLLPNGGKIALLSGVPEAHNLGLRADGFAENMRDDFEIVKTLYCDDETPKAVDIINSFTADNPDLAGWVVLGGWPFNAEPEKLSGLKKFMDNGGVCVGVDSHYPLPRFIQLGLADVLVGQDCYAMGANGVRYLYDLIATGKKPSSEFIDTGYEIVDKDNVAEALSSKTS